MLHHAATLGTVVCGCLQDILIQGEGGAQILVDPELLEHFEVRCSSSKRCSNRGAKAVGGGSLSCAAVGSWAVTEW